MINIVNIVSSGIYDTSSSRVISVTLCHFSAHVQAMLLNAT